MWNRLDYRPLEGFVFSSPLQLYIDCLKSSTAPAMMGNVNIWKPSNTQLLSAWEGMLLLEEAGLPPGVINFCGEGADVGDIVLANEHLAGLHLLALQPPSNTSGKPLGTTFKLPTIQRLLEKQVEKILSLLIRRQCTTGCYCNFAWLVRFKDKSVLRLLGSIYRKVCGK